MVHRGSIQFNSAQFNNTLIIPQGTIPLGRVHERKKEKEKKATQYYGIQRQELLQCHYNNKFKMLYGQCKQ